MGCCGSKAPEATQPAPGAVALAPDAPPAAQQPAEPRLSTSLSDLDLDYGLSSAAPSADTPREQEQLLALAEPSASEAAALLQQEEEASIASAPRAKTQAALPLATDESSESAAIQRTSTAAPAAPEAEASAAAAPAPVAHTPSSSVWDAVRRSIFKEESVAGAPAPAPSTPQEPAETLDALAVATPLPPTPREIFRPTEAQLAAARLATAEQDALAAAAAAVPDEAKGARYLVGTDYSDENRGWRRTSAATEYHWR